MQVSRIRTAVAVAFVGLGLWTAGAMAHPGHSHDQDHDHHHPDAAPTQVAHLPLHAVQAAVPSAPPPGKVSGQGDLKFRVLYTGDILPAEAQAVLVKAHGGFAVDRRRGKGATYFALPGAGIIELAPDLASARLLPTPSEMKDTNMHNATVWYAEDGTPYLAFPGNEVGKVFTTTLEGELVHVLEPPSPGMDFDEPVVNAYFAGGGRFVPTDVEQLNGLYYITTGYSSLDYVLTAQIQSMEPVDLAWHPLVFGGKGHGRGQFGTGHGITVSPDTTRIHVADRPNAEIDRFTPYGHFRDTLYLPDGAFPCDVDFESGYTVVGCLHGPNRDIGAPVYIVKDGEVVSTVLPKAELGLETFTHIHNAVMRSVNGRFYLIVQAWNPGDFAILEQVPN